LFHIYEDVFSRKFSFACRSFPRNVQGALSSIFTEGFGQA